MRSQGHPRHRHARILAAILAAPVLVEIYAVAAAQRLASAPSAVLIVALLAGSFAANGVIGAADARAPMRPEPLSASDFQPIRTFRPEAAPGVTSSPGTSLLPTAVPPTGTIGAAPLPTPTPEPPAVIRFRPRDGWTGVSPFAEVSVRFTQSMDRAATQQAFQATVDGDVVAGRYRWAEGDTVLVLTPTSRFAAGATIELAVDTTARSGAGIELAGTASARFVVAPEPTPAPQQAPNTASTETAAGWHWPLIGPITQRFGESLTRYGYHEGIDINGETGDRVRAARAGRIVVAGYADACGGLQVRIDHGGEVTSWYRHLSRILVSVGEAVTAGTVVGRVGNTGCSLGSHLHFAIQRNSTFVDPLAYLPDR